MTFSRLKSDLDLGDQKVTWKKLAAANSLPKLIHGTAAERFFSCKICSSHNSFLVRDNSSSPTKGWLMLAWIYPSMQS